MPSIQVSLEDLYNGTTRKLALSKNVICDKCEGRGGKEGAVEKCKPCKGAGVQIRVAQIAPGMVQQMQTMCSECSGKGETINPKLRCKTCQGKKVNRERKILEVHIDKGMKDGENIRFAGEGDQEPGLEAGDIIIILDEKPHEVFKRRDIDLVMSLELDLVEALCGLQRTITTLDKRTLVISTIPGEIIKPNDIKCVMNEGMPMHRNPFEKGRLIIKFDVKFPKNIQTERIPSLEKILPTRKEPIIPDGAEEHDLVEFNQEEYQQQRRREAYEDDDEDMPGGQRVQCASH